MRSGSQTNAVGGLRSLSPAAPGTSSIDPNVFGIPSTASFVSGPLSGAATTSLASLSLSGGPSTAFGSSPTTSALHHHPLLMHQPQPQHSVLQQHQLNTHHVQQQHQQHHQQQQQQQQLYNHLAAAGMNGMQSPYLGHVSSAPSAATMMSVQDMLGEGSDAIYRWKSECVHFARSGYCKRGNSCHFRHGAADGRMKPEGWRPQPHHHGAGPNGSTVNGNVMSGASMHQQTNGVVHNGYAQPHPQHQQQSQSLYSMHATQPSPPPTALGYSLQQSQGLEIPKQPPSDPWAVQSSLDSSPLITPSVSPSLGHRTFVQQPSPPPVHHQVPLSASPVPSSALLMHGQQIVTQQPQQQLYNQTPQAVPVHQQPQQPQTGSTPPSASSTPPAPAPMPPQAQQSSPQQPPSPQHQTNPAAQVLLQPTPVIPVAASPSPQPQEAVMQQDSISNPPSPVVPPLSSAAGGLSALSSASSGAPLSPTSQQAATTPNGSGGENLPKDFGHVCRYFEMGYCKYSDRCNFTHQLRNPDIPPNTSWDTDEVVRFYSSFRRAVDILKETAAGLPARVREYALDGLELCITPSADNRRNAAIKFHDLLTAALDIAVTRNSVHLPQNAKVGDKLEAVRRQLHLPTPEYDAMDRIRVLGNACQHVQGYRVALHHLSKLINALGVVFSWVTREASSAQ